MAGRPTGFSDSDSDDEGFQGSAFSQQMKSCTGAGGVQPVS